MSVGHEAVFARNAIAAIEFVGTIGIALWGLRTGRNYLAFAFAIIGVVLLIDVPSLLAADGPALTSDLLGRAERFPFRPLHHPRPQDFRRWRFWRCGASHRLNSISKRESSVQRVTSPAATSKGTQSVFPATSSSRGLAINRRGVPSGQSDRSHTGPGPLTGN